MAARTTFPGLIIGLLAVALVGAACDSGGGDDGNGGTDVVAPADQGGGGPECPTFENTTHFVAELQDFQTKALIKGGTCELLYNVYYDDAALRGEATGCTVMSDDAGLVEYDLPKDTRWGWLCRHPGPPATRETFQFNITANATATNKETLWVVSQGLYDLAPRMAGIQLDQTLGVVAGRLTWFTADGVEEYIGCATMTIEALNADGTVNTAAAPADVRYFNGGTGLPTTLEDRTNAAPENGLFIGANLPVGKVRMTAKVGDTVLGSEEIFAAAGAVVISNIEAGSSLGSPMDTPFTANPTPAGCE